jgi:hypothetical protein
MADQEKSYKETVVSNWNEIQLDGELVVLDPTEDAWEYGAPPPKGVYALKLFAAKDGIMMYQDNRDPKIVNFSISMEAKVTDDGEYKDAVVFPRVSTKVGRGKHISTAAGLIVKAGFNLPKDGITPKKLAMMVEALLKKEPIVKGEIDWQGSYKYQDKKGNDAYQSVFNSYEEFPPDGQGGRKYIVMVNNAHVPGAQVEVRARAVVNRFFGKGDALPTYNNGNALVSVPRSVLQPPMLSAPVASGPAMLVNSAAAASNDTGLLAGNEDVGLLLE